MSIIPHNDKKVNELIENLLCKQKKMSTDSKLTLELLTYELIITLESHPIINIQNKTIDKRNIL